MRTFLLSTPRRRWATGARGVTKLAYASYLAAALAYLLAQQGDPAGLLRVRRARRASTCRRARAAGTSATCWWRWRASTPAGRTEPGRALADVAELADRRSLIVLFTDLLDAPADLADRLRQLRSRGHDVALFHMLDPDEVELPFDERDRLRGRSSRTTPPPAGRPARSGGVLRA